MSISNVTLFVTMHPWCLDPARDEAVRAAEDGRPGPLPTLEDVIAEPFADSRGASETDRLRADADFLLRLAHDQTKDFGELLGVVGSIDARVERMEEMMAKTGSASSAVEHENKGDEMGTKAEAQAAAYRAEERERVKIDLPPSPEPSVARVTLEFSGRLRAPPSQWPWDLILSGACIVRSEPGESVRVVEEANDALSIAEPFLREIEGIRAAGVILNGRVAEITAERETAIRERDEVRGEITSVRNIWYLSRAANDVLKARVAELESQLESVACRAAAETALESAPAASEWRILALGEIVKDGDEYLQSDGRWLEVALRHEIRTQDVGRFRRRVTSPAASGAAGTEVVGSSVMRELIDASACLPHCGGERLQRAIAAAKGLLTQPRPAVPAPGWLTAEVVRPTVNRASALTYVAIVEARDADWLAALASAGVPWTEVGK